MSNVRIPGFEIVDLIGHGGMASVWRARQVSLDREVAIKVLSSRFAADAADVDRFQQEARAAARLKHPGIVQVYDAGQTEGVCYFVMEYVAGYTVGDWVRRKGVLPAKDAIVVAECVADALAYAWKQAGLIHCDIKPDNIIVDSDGTVKVADLGLSRTINAMNREAEDSDEVMGTPSYISPEQAMGLPDLDCRADIYSLGAMLYHLVTGTRLFEKHSEQDIMEKQCTEQCENPHELNPSLHPGLCLLIEHLLEKDRNNRLGDWATVRREIARVKAGQLPRCGLRPAVNSTIRHVSRTAPVPVADPRGRMLRRLTAHNSPAPWIVLGILILFIAITTLLVRHDDQTAPPSRIITPDSGSPTDLAPPHPPPLSQADRLRECAEIYREVVAWVDRHPNAFNEGRARLVAAMGKVDDTPYKDLLRERLDGLLQAQDDQIRLILAELDEKSRPLRYEGKLHEAAAVYENYAGDLMEETRQRRLNRASELHDLAARKESAGAETSGELTARMTAALAEVATHLLAGELQIARDTTVRQREAFSDGPDRAVMDSMATLFSKAAGLDAAILRSFGEQRGTDVTVHLVTGAVTVRVREVTADTVHTDLVVATGAGSASRSVSFGLKELSVREKLLRMGGDDQPEVALMKGVMAFRSHAFGHARKFFAAVPHPLGPVLLERVDQAESTLSSSSAPPTEETAASSTTSTASSTIPTPPLPRVQLPKHLQDIKDNPAAVTALMHKLNPRLSTGSVDIRRDAEGNAVSVTIVGAEAEDLGPLAALTTLKSVRCASSGGQESGLRDLSPLRGLALESVEVTHCRVIDLTPLRGMPLRSLNISGTRVRDLRPLWGMQLEKLNVSNTSVIDLSPVSAMPLRNLNISGTAVRRLGFLRSMPLERLEMRNCGSMDILSVTSLPLKWLDISGTSTRSIDAFASMPLTVFLLNGTSVSDIAPLGRMPQLKELDIGNTQVRDFSPLRGLKLQKLQAAQSKLADLTVLIGMPLVHLDISRSAVTDLWPLRGMELKWLNIEHLPVTDLAALKGMPLTEFLCRDISSRSFDPLHGAPIRKLWIADPDRHTRFVTTLKELTHLNGVYLEPKN